MIRGQGVCRDSATRRDPPARKIRQGEVIIIAMLPPLDESKFAHLENFSRRFYQIPPMFSAKKHGCVPRLQTSAPGKSGRARAAPCSCLVVTIWIESRCQKSISSLLCSKGFYFLTLYMTSRGLGGGAALEITLLRTRFRSVLCRSVDHVEQIKNAPCDRPGSTSLPFPKLRSNAVAHEGITKSRW